MRPGSRIALLLAALLAPTVARGDGGTLILRDARDSLVVTLLAGPTPLRAGPAVFDVLVQSRATGEPLLSGDVRLRLVGPDVADARELQARAEVGGNRLFRSARVLLPSPGAWQMEVLVTGPEGEEEAFSAPLQVAPPQGPGRRYWVYIAAAPVGLALLALHQARSLSGPRARSRGARRARGSCTDRGAVS